MGFFRSLFCGCFGHNSSSKKSKKAQKAQMKYSNNHPYHPCERSRIDMNQPRRACTPSNYSSSCSYSYSSSALVSTTVTPRVSGSWVGSKPFYSQPTPNLDASQVDTRPLAVRMGCASGYGRYNKSVNTLPTGGSQKTENTWNRWSC